MKKFVKISALVIICLLTASMLLGCSNDAPENVQDIVSEIMSSIQPTENTEYELVFPEVPSEGNEIEGYLEELNKRIETNTLKREEEIEFLESKGYIIYTGGGYFKLSYFDEYYGLAKSYLDPIIYQSDDGFEVWAINGNGELYSIKIEEREIWEFNEEGKLYLEDTYTYYAKEIYGSIHYNAKESEDILESNVNRVISYEPATGIVKDWRCGKLIGLAEVPANSVYVGESIHDGFLFKDGTDVWAVRAVYDNDGKMEEAKIIAHNVEFVITAQYETIYEYQPLFLMTDGTLKTYNGYNGDFDDVPADDESHLIDVQYEDRYDVI